MPIPWVVRCAAVVVIGASEVVGQVGSERTFRGPGMNAPRYRSFDGSTRLYQRPTLVGVYGPDGIFRKTSGPVHPPAPQFAQPGLRPAEVPPWINLGSIETIVQDYEPPAHATRAVKHQSLLASLRDRAAALAYGRERVLLAPTHVTTDSRQRLILSDPEIPAVHVLDVTGKNSLRIAGGPRHRLRAPSGVATDAADNIYVADQERGMVLVYAPDGHFLRYIGKVGEESMFAGPSGIAIDRRAGHLYILDSPMNELIVLDLEGNVLQRVGNGEAADVQFNHPTEIALGNEQLVVLDGFGQRIQLLDLQCHFLKIFSVLGLTGAPVAREIGLSVDSRSNIYVSNLNGSALWIYDRDGKPIDPGAGSLFESAQFNGPGGVWIDSADRIYVADTKNSRVQVFLAAVSPEKSLAAESTLQRNTH